jgi:hypothetical protein
MKYGLFNILLAGWALSLNSSSLAQTPQEIVEGQLAQAEQSLGPARMTSALHDTLTSGGKVRSGASMDSTQARAAAVGWNWIHAANCQTYWDGTTTWLYIFPQEGGSFWTANKVLQGTIQPACQTGKLLAFYINADGSWHQVYTYTHK